MTDLELVLKYLVYIPPIVILYFLSIGSPSFIWLVFLEVSLIAWNRSKGVWEIKPNFTEAKKWVKSLRFNGYVFFLVIHQIYNIFYWIVRPMYIETDWTLLILIAVPFLIGSLVLNSLALYVFVKKGVPRQILLIPILAFLSFTLPSLIPIWLWRIAMESRFFVILPLIPLVWVLYVRFIFLRPQPIEEIS